MDHTFWNVEISDSTDALNFDYTNGEAYAPEPVILRVRSRQTCTNTLCWNTCPRPKNTISAASVRNDSAGMFVHGS
jgi:hypothetical protein